MSDLLPRLLHKYERLAELRARRETVEATGATEFEAAEGAERRKAFRRLAEEFPGSLRELDRHDAATFEARAAAVRETLASGTPAPLWMSVAADYHALLRDVLAVKAWLAGANKRSAEVEATEFATWYAGHPHRRRPVPDDMGAFLDLHRRPPGSKMQNIVYAELEARHGVDEKRARQLMYRLPPS